MTINQIITKLLECDLSSGQRKCLNDAIRMFRARRPNGGRVHNPSHYVPQFLSLAKKFGVVTEETKISKVR